MNWKVVRRIAGQVGAGETVRFGLDRDAARTIAGELNRCSRTPAYVYVALPEMAALAGTRC